MKRKLKEGYYRDVEDGEIIRVSYNKKIKRYIVVTIKKGYDGGHFFLEYSSCSMLDEDINFLKLHYIRISKLKKILLVG